MARRSEIVSPKDTLRDMVLKHGGVMGMTEILASRQFRRYDLRGRIIPPSQVEPEIRQLVYQLRKKNKGRDFGYGVEAWELLDRVVFGLESRLRQCDRRRISMRRRAKEKGVSEQGEQNNIAFKVKIQHDGVVHKEEIIRGLDASSKALRQTAETSTSTREILVEHEEDFGDETP